MNHDLFPIYTQCFPGYPMREENFYDTLRPGSEFTHIIRAFDAKGNTVGFALVCGRTITLICVLPDYRGQGYGALLLKKAERLIRADHINTPIILGYDTAHYIFQGVPIEYGAVGFFEKYGYTAPETTMNMGLELVDFDIERLNLPEPEGIRFRLAEESDRPALIAAIEDTNPEWHDYFADYEDAIMLAVSDTKIIGFQMLDMDGVRLQNAHEKMGCIGCVGIINEAREKGIGRRMVAEGICWLREQGCVAIELLYVAIPEWYEKLGFYSVSKQWMGRKDCMKVARCK